MSKPDECKGTGLNEGRAIEFSDGSHMVGIYTIEENILNAVIPFFVEGLKGNDKCFYAASPETILKVKKALKEKGIDIAKALEKGQLVLLDKKDPLLKDGEFDPEYLVELYRQDVENSINAGWDHVRATAEMSWLIDGEKGRENILYYEALSTKLFNNTKKVHALCQYNTTLMSGAELIELVKIHPWALIDDRIGENPYWIDPKPEKYSTIN